MARHINARGLRLLESFEGLRLSAYRATPAEPYLTVGYGHYGPDVKPGQRITPLRAVQLLKRDLRTAERAVEKGVAVGLNTNRFSALVVFVYNVGVGAFNTSTLRRKLNAGQYRAVPSELMKWTRAGGVVYPGLVRRRRAEGGLYSTKP